jgi:ABC-type transport system involved in Fe-S cluster assembly fused permease/ATPase subunit
MENMFDLLNEEPEVIDAPGAPPLAITGGKVEFRNVVFSYVPERCVLRNISFVVPPGKTVALVSDGQFILVSFIATSYMEPYYGRILGMLIPYLCCRKGL